MKIVSGPTLSEMIQERCHGIKAEHVDVADRDYALLERRHVDQLAKYVRNMLFRLNVLKWQPHWDCDDYSRLAMLAASLMHKAALDQAGRVSPEAAAVGELSYLIDGLPFNGHRLNIIALDDLTIQAWEPQKQQFTELSDLEWSTSWRATL